MKNNHSTNRGSALMMAIVMTLLLFIIGTAFLMSARTDTQTVAAVDDLATSDNAVQAVIGQINAVLVQDLFGPYNTRNMLDSKFVDQNGDFSVGDLSGNLYVSSNEPYDYPSHQLYKPPTAPDIKSDSIINPIDGTFFNGDDLYVYDMLSDPWLADIEPTYVDYRETADPADDDIGFRHITDLYGYLASYYEQSYLTSDRNPATGIIDPAAILQHTDDNLVTGDRISFRNLHAVTISDNDPIFIFGAKADADGDGVADARWVPIPNITGPRGEACYTAVRIIDNCGMINVNTAYWNNDASEGYRPTDISLQVLTPPSDSLNNKVNAANLIYACRTQTPSGDIPNGPNLFASADINNYCTDIIFRLDNPGLPSLLSAPLPDLYAINDELELRHRYFINSGIMTPLENVWPSFLVNGYKETPFDGSPTATNVHWFNDILWLPNTSDRRHFLTTYSWDRTARGFRSTTSPVTGFADTNASAAQVKALQVDINSASAEEIAGTMIYAYEFAASRFFGDTNERKRVAQLACNIVDFRDTNNNCSYLHYFEGSNNGAANTYVFGLECQPFISEISAKIDSVNPDVQANNTFQVKLYNPYPTDITDFVGYLLRVYKGATKIGTDIDLGTAPELAAGLTATTESAPITISPQAYLANFNNTPAVTEQYTLALIRIVSVSGGSEEILLDKWKCPNRSSTDPIWLEFDDMVHALPKSKTDWDVIWLTAPSINYNINIPNTAFNNSGELTRVLTIGPPHIPAGADVDTLQTWGELLANNSNIEYGRLNAEVYADAQLLNYVTTFSRATNGIDDDGSGIADDLSEIRVPGRININTAPLRVIATLPWVQDPSLPDTNTTERDERLKFAKAILGYRDKLKYKEPGSPDYGFDYDDWNFSNARLTNLDGRARGINESSPPSGIRETPGFASLGELINVTQDTSASYGSPYTYTYDNTNYRYDIRRYINDPDPSKNNTGTANDPFYDTYDSDTVADDLLERDILLHRVSNLATVRSDVFTAYIAVRIGEAGPIRRVMAIFDRSNVFSASDTPKLVALQPVADPD